MKKSKIALAQLTSTDDRERNLKIAVEFIQKASGEKADLIAFPENFSFLGKNDQCLDVAEPVPGPLVEKFQGIAREQSISILMGSMYECVPDNPKKVHNTSILIDEKGDIVSTYRKIHLFDIDLPDVKHVESKSVEPGNTCVTCDHKIGTAGLTICYDVRFPNLYQKLREKGAEVIFVPAAFTVPTGKAHWINLLRSRAIENQVYIAAPAQYGRHNKTRESFGSSVLIDPWGDVKTVAPNRETLIFGETDPDVLEDVRRRMPVFTHRRAGIDF